MCFLDILNNNRNMVFLGESGSGKSEIALNVAVALAEAGQTVDLFDLDQTKPLFRSRDALQKLAGSGIRIHYAEQLLDTPVIVPGVRESLISPDVYTILDIGGFDIGAKMIGRFAGLLDNSRASNPSEPSDAKESPGAEAFYIVNPYRPWSGDAENIRITMEGIRRATRLSQFTCIANPHLGPETTAEEFLQGLEMTRVRLPEGVPLRGACCRKELIEEIRQSGVTLPLQPLQLFLSYEWTV